MIVVVDYGMGNLGSILNMLKKIGAEAELASEPEDVRRASKLILPGVGAFDSGMRHLEQRGFIEALNERVLSDGVPTLGVCLGMQLLTARSEEGELPGLGWLDGETVRFQFDGRQQDLRIPHMGWNTVSIRRQDGLFETADMESRYYFVHSYHVVCNHSEDILATTNYGYDFASAVRKRNIMGVQFHPEKSHRFGQRLLQCFVEQV